MTCHLLPDHKLYKKRAHAVRDYRALTAKAKRTGAGGDSWRYLNIFQCGGHWHIGRSKLITPKPAPESKRPPTFEKLKRKIRSMEREWDRQNRERAAFLGKLVEIDRALGLID